jgi:hypothetical protein
MFFPQPEISTGGETFKTYAMRYSWYINIMCATTEDAHEKAWKVLTALKQRRNLVPLLGDDGKPTGTGLRLNDPTIQNVDTGVVQITLEWTSRRPYIEEDIQKMIYFEVNGWQQPDIYNTVDITTSIKNTVTSYTNDYPIPKHAGEYP